MIDPFSEDIVPLTEAAKTLSRRPNVSTLHRWRLSGIRNVKLETMMFGGRRVTSREALDRFSLASLQQRTATQCQPRLPANANSKLRAPSDLRTSSVSDFLARPAPRPVRRRANRPKAAIKEFSHV